MRVVRITDDLLKMFPGRSRKEIRFIVQGIVKSINKKLRNARILKFTVPGLGEFKTHGGRVKTNKKHRQRLDRDKKRKIYKENRFKKENILW